MPEFNSTVAAKIAELRKVYLAQLPSKVAELKNVHDEAFGEVVAREPLATFYRLAHSLAGSGAIYGVNRVGEKARELENYLKPLVEEDSAGNDEVRRKIITCLHELECMIDDLVAVQA